MSNIFVANAMKSTTNNIWANLSNKIISKHACRFLCYCYCKTLCQISIVAYSITLTDMHVDIGNGSCVIVIVRHCVRYRSLLTALR